MATSLQRQLNALRSEIPVVTERQRVASFLFDHKTASDTGSDTIYNLALNGYTELCQIEERLTTFQKALFSHSASQLHRTQESQAINSKLDETLGEFLVLLSPYFLLKPTHKVIEYLIRHFRIHLFNVDQVMACILPYHQTPAFFRMARLLETKGSKWEFLKTSIKAGTSLSRETLVHKCVSDVAVLQFVCDMATRSAKFRVRSSVTTVTFSTVVLLEAIAYTRGKMSEPVLRILIQHVVSGIQSHDDFQTSALMITGQLASSVTFKKDACDSLLQFICKHAIEKSFSENALLVLVQICATQTLFEFPSKAFAHLIKSSQIAPTLTQLSASYDVSAFLRLTLLAGVEHCVKHENYLTALKALLACPAAKPHVATVIRNAVQMYTTLGKDAVSEKQALSAVLRSVEYTYPDEVDQGLRSAMESLSQEGTDGTASSAASKQAIFAVASQAFRHPRHQLVSETSDTVFISLTHPNPDIRITAMSLLVSGGGDDDGQTGKKKNKVKGKKDQRRSSVEQSSPSMPVESLPDIAVALLDRLRDDHLGVAKHAVTHLHTLAPLLHQHQCVDGSVLFETCESVLARVMSAEDDLSSSAVKLCAKIFSLLTTELLEIEGDMERRLAVLCLKHLLVTKKTDKLSAAARKVAGRDWSTFTPLFANLTQDNAGTSSSKKSKNKKDKAATDSGNRAIVDNMARNLLAISRADGAGADTLETYYTLLQDASTSISGHILSLLTLTRFLSLLSSDNKGSSLISNHAVAILLKLTAQHIHGVSSPARATTELSYEDDTPGSGLLSAAAWADIEGTGPSGMALSQSRVIVYVYVSLSHTLVSKPSGSGSSSSSGSVMSSGVRNICASILSSPRWFATLVPAFQAFLQAHNHGHPLQFLSVFYLDDIPSSCGHSVLRRTRSLQLTQSYLAGHDGARELDTDVCHHIASALLTTLCTNVKEVRQFTLACLHALTPAEGVLGDILSAVLAVEEEILGSPDYVTQVLAGLLSDPALASSDANDTKGSKGGKGKKKRGENKSISGLTLAQQRQAVILLVTQALQLPSERGTAVALHTLRHVRHGQMILPLLKHLTAYLKAYQASSTARRSGSEACQVSWAQYTLYYAVHHVADDIEVASSNPAMDHFLGLFSLSCHAASSAATLDIISADDQLQKAQPSSTVAGQPLALACIQVTTPTFYAALKEEHKVALLSTLFDALATSPAVVGEAVKALCTSLPSPAQHVGEILTQVSGQLRDAAPGAKASANSPTKRVRRTTAAADDGAPGTSSQFRALISRLTSIVEVVHLIIQPSLDIVNGLVRHLFATLAVVREVGGALLESEDRSLDYVQLLLFQALEKITSFIVQWRQDKDQSPVKNIASFLKDLEALYDTDALFTTLTTSPNPQTQNSALLLLTSTAALYPKKTVQHIVPALSAIGSLGWRQDDEYTYQSLTRAISHIVPMMMSLPESDREGLTPVALINVFVEALPGIPSLRRQRVCQALLQALGAEVVHYFVVALMGKVALNKTFIMSASEINASEEESGKSVTTETLMRSPAVTLAHEVLADFGGLDQMTGLGKLLEWVSDLPLDDATLLKVQRKAVKNSTGTNKDKGGKGNANPDILDWSLYALPHLKLIRLALLQFCLNHAESTEFLDEMVLTADDDGNERSFTDSVEKVLKISRVATDAQVAARNEQNRKLDSYWTQVDGVVVQLLNAFTDLLSIPTFGSLVGNLIAFDEGMIRARGLSLLLSRVEREEKRETLRDQGEPLCDLVDPIRSLVINKKESPETVQLGLQCLSTLCIQFGTVQPNVFVEALAELSTILERSKHLAVRGACALALGHFCEQLGAKTLAHLQKFLPVVIDCLTIEDDRGLADGTPADQNLFLECVLSSCQALVSSVGAFTHPKIGVLVRNLLESDLTRRGTLDDSIRATLMTVAEEIPSQVAVPVATSLYKHALGQGEAALVHYLDFVNAICKRIDASRVKALYRTLAKFFLSAFDFRRLHASSVPAPDRIENLIVETFCSFVLKLSESLFKPLFVKIVEWYQVNPAVPADDLSTLPNPWRAYMFARVLDAVASRLKTLIVPYFGSIMTDLLRDLDDEHDAFNVRGEGVDDDEEGGGLFLSAPPTPGGEGKAGKKKRKRRRENGFTLSDRRELRHNHTVYILSALTSCFTYDDESFITPEIFEGATDPLVAQLARLEGDVVLFQQRVDEALIPCITALAACLREESVWKPLNHKVLLQTRSEEAPARFAALRTLQSLFTKLGEEYLTLLPETIPFLAELLEDDNPMVERLAKEVANQLTDLSGENIQDMLQM